MDFACFQMRRFSSISNYYAPDSEAAIRWDDPDLAIDWGIPAEDVILSEKDAHHPALKEIEDVFFI